MSSGLAQKYLSVPSIRSICIGEDRRLHLMLPFSHIYAAEERMVV